MCKLCCITCSYLGGDSRAHQLNTRIPLLCWSHREGGNPVSWTLMWCASACWHLLDRHHGLSLSWGWWPWVKHCWLYVIHNIVRAQGKTWRCGYVVLVLTLTSHGGQVACLYPKRYSTIFIGDKHLYMWIAGLIVFLNGTGQGNGVSTRYNNLACWFVWSSLLT